MYKQVKTHEKAVLQNGVEITPVATLEDEYGGRAHFAVDDHCYQLYVERHDAVTSEAEPRDFAVPVTHIFPEAFELLKTLPELERPFSAVHYSKANTMRILEDLQDRACKLGFPDNMRGSEFTDYIRSLYPELYMVVVGPDIIKLENVKSGPQVEIVKEGH